jgi:Tol biopolymer transport system component
MCVALAAAVLAAFLVVVLGTPTKPAEAAFPGKNGKIVFESHPDLSNSEIVTMNANGDNKTQLTNTSTPERSPTFSPNGKMIAFASDRNGNADIYTMSANGTDIKRVTRSESSDFDPAWSPDGTGIAFASSSTGNTDIYVINKDGTGLTRLTTSAFDEANPAWSPDGIRIAFVRGIPNTDFKIYVMKAARESQTNIPQRLTSISGTLFEAEPAWSPDGTRIAFVLNRNKLYSIRADGSDQIRLTTTSLGSDPAWSPDGTRIAFRGKRGPHTHTDWRIFVMKAKPQSETNRPKRLTGSSPRGDYRPDWQPLR